MTARDLDSTGGNKLGQSSDGDLVDLPLRPGAAGPGGPVAIGQAPGASGDLQYDPLGGVSEDPAAAGRGGAGQRQAYHRRRRRGGIWWLAALLVAAVLSWLLFPGPPRVELSLASLDFGTVRVGAASEEQTVVVTNTGERRLRIKSLTVGAGMEADFEVAEEACVGGRLATGESCLVRVRFRPQTAGDRGTALVIDSNDRHSTPLALEALAVAPELGLAPSALAFDVVPLDEVAARKVTLSNVGSATLEIRRIRIDGPAAAEFSRSSRCPSSRLEPGGSCTFDIRFAPSVSGTRRAALIVDSDAPGSPGELPLEGVGRWTGPPLDPSSELLDLGEQRVGVRSSSGRLTFTNRTGGAVSVDKTAISGSSSFAAVEDTCRGSSVPSGGSCVVALTFLPVTDGPAQGWLSLSAAGASEESRVDLRGRGVTPRLDVEVKALDFKGQRLGFESAPRAARFKNSGTATLTFKSVAIVGAEGADFLLRSNECLGKPLAPGRACVLNVGFSPSGRGARAAALAVDPGFGLAPVRIGLAGVGVASALAVSPGRLDFGEVYLGRLAGRSLTLANDGSAGLRLSGLRLEGDDAPAFELGQMGCALDAGLAPGASCRIEVGFAPEAAVSYRAQLVLAHNGPDSPARVQLVGAGRAPEPAFRISTTALDLGSVTVGDRGEIGTVIISNPGAAWLDLKSISLRGDDAEDFQLVPGTCDGIGALAPSGECTVGVRLAPVTAGPRLATLQVRHGAGAGVASVTLRGEGLAR